MMVVVKFSLIGASMRFSGPKVVFVCVFASSFALLSAATPSIGVAMSEGSILINHSRAAGNATIFEGTILETQSAVSQVHLNGGAQFRLAADSRGTVFADHVNLEKGSARIAGYSASASGLNIRADGSASATVSMRDQGVVQIAALTGSVHVFNAAGINVANLLPGRALDLQPQDAGASAPSSLVGCAVKSGNNTLFTDETSNVTVQLQGGNVRVGRRVQITGSMAPNATPASPATQVINVTNVKQVGGTCKSGSAGAAAAGGAAAGGAAAAVGISTAAIAGIAVAGAAAVAVGATAAAGGFTSSGTTTTGSRTGTFN
jgi:hypothetical protein